MIRGVEADLCAVGGVEEPAGLARVIRPERGVEVVGNEPVLGVRGSLKLTIEFMFVNAPVS